MDIDEGKTVTQEEVVETPVVDQTPTEVPTQEEQKEESPSAEPSKAPVAEVSTETQPT